MQAFDIDPKLYGPLVSSFRLWPYTRPDTSRQPQRTDESKEPETVCDNPPCAPAGCRA